MRPETFIAFAIGYLLGSIPFGLILTRIAGTQDIRSIGSGNIGATNVLRTGRKGLAAATLIGDALKGTVAVLIVKWLYHSDLVYIAAFAAFIGHIFPVWLKFNGGKGVATFIGLLIALYWPAAVFFCAVWLLVAWLSRYSSLSALVASAASPIFLYAMHQSTAAALFLLLSLLLWINHRANIARLMSGTEGRIGDKSGKTAESVS